jgi:hypothetical protein
MHASALLAVGAIIQPRGAGGVGWAVGGFMMGGRHLFLYYCASPPQTQPGAFVLTSALLSLDQSLILGWSFVTTMLARWHQTTTCSTVDRNLVAVLAARCAYAHRSSDYC